MAVNPKYGTPADLKALVAKAHGLGMKVRLDAVLNHSSWDSALTREHPAYDAHTDGNPESPASIAVAVTWNDVARLDDQTPGNGLAECMTKMLQAWVTTYGIDGRGISASTR